MSEELQPPVPAQPLVDPNVTQNDPNRVETPVEPGEPARRDDEKDPSDLPVGPNGEDLEGEGGDGGEPYDGGEVPSVPEETSHDEDRDALSDDLDR